MTGWMKSLSDFREKQVGLADTLVRKPLTDSLEVQHNCGAKKVEKPISHPRSTLGNRMRFYYVTYQLIDPSGKGGPVPGIKTAVIQLDHGLEYQSDIEAAEEQLHMLGMEALLLSWQELKGQERPENQ